MRTYNEWLVAGRVPAAGERAEHYRVNADRSEGVALFREDQTIPIEPANPDLTDVITREEWDAGAAARRRTVAKPTAKLCQDARGTFRIWVGNNKPVIEHLKKNGWRFNSRDHRWCAKLEADISYVQAALEKLGCTVVVDDAC